MLSSLKSEGTGRLAYNSRKNNNNSILTENATSLDTLSQATTTTVTHLSKSDCVKIAYNMDALAVKTLPFNILYDKQVDSDHEKRVELMKAFTVALKKNGVITENPIECLFKPEYKQIYEDVCQKYERQK